VAAQEQQPPEPPEEDESVARTEREYVLNPIQASKEMKIGDFYFKKGAYKAAQMRYEEATRWNPGLAEAFLKLGEASEKLKDDKAAQEAYTKYLELAPDAKNAPAIRKKLPRR
jgi:tetratricopeptide (TPR) repeat protein